MININEKLKFIINLSKTQSDFNRLFEGGLGNGLTFNEFLILLNLNQTDDKRLRRLDLAKKIGLSASGITRILLPMEKIGLINNQTVAEDARVKIVQISKSGQTKIKETLDRLNDLIEEILSPIKDQEIKKISKLLAEVDTRILRS